MDKLVFFDEDISDPWHQPVHVFQACAEMMKRQFDGIYHKMMAEERYSYEGCKDSSHGKPNQDSYSY